LCHEILEIAQATGAKKGLTDNSPAAQPALYKGAIDCSEHNSTPKNQHPNRKVHLSNTPVLFLKENRTENFVLAAEQQPFTQNFITMPNVLHVNKVQQR